MCRHVNDVCELEVMIRWASNTAGILTPWGHMSELVDENEGEIDIFKIALIDLFNHWGSETNYKHNIDTSPHKADEPNADSPFSSVLCSTNSFG